MMCRLSIRSWSLGLCVALALLAPPARGESPKEAGAKSKAKAAAKKETEKKAPARQAKVKDAPAKKKGQEKTPAPSGGEKQKGAAEGATTTTPNESASKTQQQAAVGKTATVKQGPLKVEVKIDGYVKSADGHEIAVAPKEWTQFMVLEAIPAGTKVTKGQTLVKFDATPLDEAIAKLKANQKLAELALRQAEIDAKIAQQSLPLSTQLVEQARKFAAEDLARHEKKEGPFAKKAAAMQQKIMEQYLAYALEELKQLEKMYKADDLTDETEEIILTRARNDVEQYKFLAESARMQTERHLEVDLPRMLEQYKQQAQAAELAFQKASAMLPLLRDKYNLELEKQKFERTLEEKKLADLVHDRGLMELKAPADGYVYYGRATRGKWNSSELAAKLRPGGTISAREVIVTVVPNEKLSLRGTLKEQDRAHVRAGMAASATLAALGKEPIAAKVQDVSSIPVGDKEYDISLELAATPPSGMVAGMTAEIKLTAYYNAAAVQAPASAVFTEPSDENARFVYVVGDDGKPQKRTVKVGHKQGDQIEIVSGLSAGEKILLEKPE